MAKPGHEGLGKAVGKEVAGSLALGKLGGGAKELGRLAERRLGPGEVTAAQQEAGAGQQGLAGCLDGNKLGEVRLAAAAGRGLAIALAAARWALHGQDSM